MTKFWEIIISSVVGASLALLGAIVTMRIQDNRSLKNAKFSISVELRQIKDILVDIRGQAIDSKGTLSVDVIQTNLYYPPSDFDTYKISLSQLKPSDFRKVSDIYRKIKEFEELRLILLKKKEDGIDLSAISNKEKLSTEERTLKKYMDIYLNYYLNMDLLISEINEVYKLVE